MDEWVHKIIYKKHSKYTIQPKKKKTQYNFVGDFYLIKIIMSINTLQIFYRQ